MCTLKITHIYTDTDFKIKIEINKSTNKKTDKKDIRLIREELLDYLFNFYVFKIIVLINNTRRMEYCHGKSIKYLKLPKWIYEKLNAKEDYKINYILHSFCG